MALRHWVGGAGSQSFQNMANWSATPGGAGGASVPTGNDEAFIESGSSDINSGLSNPSFTGALTVTGGFTGTIGTSGGTGLVTEILLLQYSGSARYAYFGSTAMNNITEAQVYATNGGQVRFVAGGVGTLKTGFGANIDVANGVSLGDVQNGGSFVNVGTHGFGTLTNLLGSVVTVGSASTINIFEGRVNVGGMAPVLSAVKVYGGGTYNHRSGGTIHRIDSFPGAEVTSDGARSAFTVTNSVRWIGSTFFEPSFVKITFTNPTVVEGAAF